MDEVEVVRMRKEVSLLAGMRKPNLYKADAEQNEIAPGIDDGIYADHHSLQFTYIPEEKLPLVNEDGTIVEGIFQYVEPHKIQKLFIREFLDSGQGMDRISHKLQEAGPDDQLELHISSYGGYVNELSVLHNLINGMYSERSVSYLNYGYSAGAMAFIIPKERVVYNTSVIMFHFFSGGESGKGFDMVKSLNHSMENIGTYYRKQLRPYFTKSEIDDMIKGEEFYLNHREMLERNIATNIIVDGKYLTGAEYLEAYDESGFKKVLEKPKKTKKTKKKKKKSEKKSEKIKNDTELRENS